MQNAPGENLIPSAALDALLLAHDGDMALLYIYALKNGSIEPEKAARALYMTVAQVEAAEEKLRLQGILTGGSSPAAKAAVVEPEDVIPEYSAKDITVVIRDDDAFSAVVQEARKILGHSLSTPDLKKLFGIYDYLALPPEVIMVLLNHCVKIAPGRRPSMRYIEKEAFFWANREITTHERAEEYIRRYNERTEAISRVKDVLNIRGRELSSTEAKHIGEWLDMGFAEDAMAEAYDRTVTNTGALKWNYMSRIMQSWHKNGIHTAAEIAEKDPRRGNTAGAKVSTAGGTVDIEELRKTIDKL